MLVLCNVTSGLVFIEQFGLMVHAHWRTVLSITRFEK